MLPTLRDKLNEFSDAGKLFLKATEDMQYVTRLHETSPDDLTDSDIAFLLEISEPIHSFGYHKDSRISEILNRIPVHKLRVTIARILNISPDEVLCSSSEFFRSTIEERPVIAFFGRLFLTSKKLEKSTLPKYVFGDLDLSIASNFSNIVMPELVTGDLICSGLLSTRGLSFPDCVRGYIDLPDNLQLTAEEIDQYRHGLQYNDDRALVWREQDNENREPNAVEHAFLRAMDE